MAGVPTLAVGPNSRRVADDLKFLVAHGYFHGSMVGPLNELNRIATAHDSERGYAATSARQLAEVLGRPLRTDLLVCRARNLLSIFCIGGVSACGWIPG